MNEKIRIAAFLLGLILMIQSVSLVGSAASVPITYELYDYFLDLENARLNGQTLDSDSPWSVQIKALEGEWTQTFDTAVRNDSYTYVYSSQKAWGMYPGFSFNTVRGNGDRLYLNQITPTNSAGDAEWKINTAYTFCAPEDGCYSLGVASQDDVYAFGDCNFFHQWDNGKAIDFGLRITVNDITIWPVSEGEIRDGFRVFGTDTALEKSIEVPQLDTVLLNCGDNLRYEFISFTPISDSPWTQRICGTPSVTYRGSIKSVDAVSVSWDYKRFTQENTNEPTSLAQTLSGADSYISNDDGLFGNGKNLSFTVISENGLGDGLRIKYGSFQVVLSDTSSSFLCDGCCGIPFSCPVSSTGKYDISICLKPLICSDVTVGTEIYLSVNKNEYSADFPKTVSDDDKLFISGGTVESPLIITGAAITSSDSSVRIDRMNNVIFLKQPMTGKYFTKLMGDSNINATGVLNTGSTVSKENSFEVFNIAVRYDVTGDGKSDIRDLIRAKKACAGVTELSAAQIYALTNAEDYTVSAQSLCSLQNYLLGQTSTSVLRDNLVYTMAKGNYLSQNLISEWNILGGDVTVQNIVGHNKQNQSVYRMSSEESVESGIYTVIDRPTVGTYCLSGYSKAENVTRTVGTEYYSYSIVASVGFADGTSKDYSTTFSYGTYDWEYRETNFTITKAPVNMTVYVFLRSPAQGIAYFDDVSLVKGNADTYTFYDRPILKEALDNASSSSKTFSTDDGLSISVGDSSISSVSVNNKDLTSSGASGFLLRDVASNTHSGVYALDGDISSSGKYSGNQSELGLSVEASFTEKENCISVSGVVRDVTHNANGRAVELSFALPIKGKGKTWSSAIDEQMLISTGDNRCVYHSYAPGNMEIVDWDSEKHSYSPVSALYNDQYGISISVGMDFPSYWILEYNAGTENYVVTYQLGITEESPDSARFAFDIYLLNNPSWGYRSALEKYKDIHPYYYTVREKNHGLWNAWIDLTGVSNISDFNIRFKENDGDARKTGMQEVLRGIKGYYYIEPGDWWVSDIRSNDREELLAHFSELAKGDTSQLSTRQAIASLFCTGTDINGNLNANPVSVGWCTNGTQVHVNSNPALPGRYNFYNLFYNESLKKVLFNRNYMTGTAVFDGIYLDELNGWWLGNANFNKEHFRYTTVPLTYSPDYKSPMLHRASTTWEFVSEISNSLHSDGKTVMANKAVEKNVFYMPLVDVIGTEQTAMSGSEYSPQSLSTLAVWRSMAYTKPFCILLSNDYDLFDHETMEKYICRCMTYGIFPSPHDNYNHNGQYFNDAAYYERDRDLFVKYMPSLKTISESGWEPVTAVTTNAALTVERFGTVSNIGSTYLVIYNEGKTDITSALQLDLAELGLTDGYTVTDMINGGSETMTGSTVSVSVSAERVTVLKLNLS